MANRPPGRTWSPRSLITAINSVIRGAHRKVFETPLIDNEEFGALRLSAHYMIDFHTNKAKVADPDVDLEELGRDSGVMGPYDKLGEHDDHGG